MIKVQKSYGEILVDTAVDEGYSRGYAIGYARGYARGVFINKLENAQNMLVRDSTDNINNIIELPIEYIAGIVELPIEYILELESGTSIDKMIEKYFHYDNKPVLK